MRQASELTAEEEEQFHVMVQEVIKEAADKLQKGSLKIIPNDRTRARAAYSGTALTLSVNLLVYISAYNATLLLHTDNRTAELLRLNESFKRSVHDGMVSGIAEATDEEVAGFKAQSEVLHELERIVRGHPK